MAGLLGQASMSAWDLDLHRSDIQRVLSSDQLLKSISIDGAGRIDLQVCDWEAYWRGLALPDSSFGFQLDHLHAARKQYLESGYVLDQAVPYCQAYFGILRDLLKRPNANAALRALLGLESFGIGWLGREGFSAAGTITIRHPVYLLAKLREPVAYEDAKFLPLICPQSSEATQGGALFYYYRQIKIQSAPAASLLIYPSVELSQRHDSFDCIEAVSSALSFKPDPRCKQRAMKITDWAVAPFLQNNHRIRPEVSFVDLGGGSGALLAETCKQLVKEHQPTLAGRKFVWSIVDVGLQDATRRTRNRELRQHISYIEYLPADYARWLVEQGKGSVQKYDVALICRLLNNMSCINIEASSDSAVIAELSSVRKRLSPSVMHPADCLAGPLPDCRSLVASNARVRLCGGSTFRQASLSDSIRALYCGANPRNKEEGHAFYFPVRRFNEEALILPDGSTMLDHLTRMAGMIVIEDVDLNAETLVDHMTRRGLNDLAASDATDRVRMQSASLLCVCRRELEAALPGRRIW